MQPGVSLEKDVRRIYSFLLNMRDEGVVVGTRVSMVGKSGAKHEIDVYYEFLKAGVRHRVAIECKDWINPVSKGQIQEFDSKLRDVGNIIGVVVSRNGYQSGADKFAKYYDIMPLRFEDLPSFGTLMADRLGTVALPDESYVGEPFWIIMEIRNGSVTGSHYGTTDHKTGRGKIPLMFSKIHAEKLFQQAQLDPNHWVVRGLPRFALRAFLITLELYEKRMNTTAILCFPSQGIDSDTDFIGIDISRENLIREYYGEAIPSIEDEMNR